MPDSIQLSDSQNSSIFINDLIEMTRKKDKELKIFIDKNLFPKNSKISIEAINENIKSLEGMSAIQQTLVKARAKSFEESNDPSKYFPTLMAIFGLVISLYTLLREMTENSVIIALLSILVTSALAIYAIKVFTNTIKIRKTAIFFNSLINSVKFKD